MTEDLAQGFLRLVDPVDIGGVHHKDHAVRHCVIVLPDVSDSLPATQVKDGHLEFVLLHLNPGKSHSGCHILGIFCENKHKRRRLKNIHSNKIYRNVS